MRFIDAIRPTRMNHARTRPRARQRQTGLAKFLALVATAAACVLVYALYDQYLETRVERVESLGSLQRVLGGTLGYPVIVETETAYLPLERPLAIAKGAPLVLETRANQTRYVCSADQTICARTTRKTLDGAPAGPAARTP